MTISKYKVEIRVMIKGYGQRVHYLPLILYLLWAKPVGSIAEVLQWSTCAALLAEHLKKCQCPKCAVVVIVT